MASSARLVEVWAGEAGGDAGKCGSGWVLGGRAVLTAKHVVSGAATIQVRPASATEAGAWVDASIRWEHPWLDVGVLEVAPSRGQAWREPQERSPRLASVGTRAIAAEAVGFPDAAQRPDRLRRPDHAKGTLSPGGADRDEQRLMALDVVDASVPDDADLWHGFSGAAVRDEHDRVVAVVVQVHPDRQQRRLLVLSVEEAADDAAFADAARALGVDPIVEDRCGPLWKSTVTGASLSAAGVPVRVRDAADVGVFGVHDVVATDTGRDAFAPYVKRTTDRDLDAALKEAADGGRRVVLVIGDSAAGKSRCAAEAIRRHETLSERPLIVPNTDRGLTRLLDAELAVDTAIVWLDDLDKYLENGLNPAALERVLDESPDAVIVATMRRSKLQTRQEGLADPAWRLLTDEEVVRRVEIAAAFEPTELAAAHATFSNPRLLSALDRGVGLGEFLVGGPELRTRLDLLTGYAEHLANTVIAWFRTGLGSPITESSLRLLWQNTLPAPEARAFVQRPADTQHRLFRKAAEDVCRPVISRDAHDIALVTELVEGYEADDYIVDYVARQPAKPIVARLVWETALSVATSDDAARDERLWRIGVAAHDEPAPEVALAAMQALADLGDLRATVNVGAVLAQLERSEEALAVYDESSRATASRRARAARTGRQGAGQQGRHARGAGSLRGGCRSMTSSSRASAMPPSPALREQVAEALVNKGVTLGALERSEEELAVYDERRRALRRRPEPRRCANRSPRRWSTRASRSGRWSAPRKRSRSMTSSSRASASARARRCANRSPGRWSTRASRSGRWSAPRRRSRSMTRSSRASARRHEPALREQVARALFNKGVRLGALERSEEELAVYDERRRALRRAPEPGAARTGRQGAGQQGRQARGAGALRGEHRGL